MSTESRTEFSRLLWGGYEHITRILWWLRWPIAGLAAAVIVVEIVKH